MPTPVTTFSSVPGGLSGVLGSRRRAKPKKMTVQQQAHSRPEPMPNLYDANNPPQSNMPVFPGSIKQFMLPGSKPGPAHHFEGDRNEGQYWYSVPDNIGASKMPSSYDGYTRTGLAERLTRSGQPRRPQQRRAMPGILSGRQAGQGMYSVGDNAGDAPVVALPPGGHPQYDVMPSGPGVQNRMLTDPDDIAKRLMHGMLGKISMYTMPNGKSVKRAYSPDGAYFELGHPYPASPPAVEPNVVPASPSQQQEQPGETAEQPGAVPPPPQPDPSLSKYHRDAAPIAGARPAQTYRGVPVQLRPDVYRGRQTPMTPAELRSTIQGPATPGMRVSYDPQGDLQGQALHSRAARARNNMAIDQRNTAGLQGRVGTGYRSPNVQAALEGGVPSRDTEGVLRGRMTASGQQYASVPQAQQTPAYQVDPTVALRQRFLHGDMSEEEAQSTGFDMTKFGRYRPGQTTPGGGAIAFQAPEGGTDGQLAGMPVSKFGIAGRQHVRSMTQPAGFQGPELTDSPQANAAGVLTGATGDRDGSPYQLRHLSNDVAMLRKKLGVADTDEPIDVADAKSIRSSLAGQRRAIVDQERTAKAVAASESQKDRGLAAMIDRAQRTGRGMARVPGLRHQLLARQGMVPGGESVAASAATGPLSLPQRTASRAAADEWLKTNKDTYGDGDDALGLERDMNRRQAEEVIQARIDDMQETDFESLGEYFKMRIAADPKFMEGAGDGSIIKAIINEKAKGRRKEFADKAKTIRNTPSQKPHAPVWQWHN